MIQALQRNCACSEGQNSCSSDEEAGPNSLVVADDVSGASPLSRRSKLRHTVAGNLVFGTQEIIDGLWRTKRFAA